MIITIIGVDGVGKTTLAKNLSRTIKDSTYTYAGYNPENRKYFLFNKFIKKKRKSLLGRFFIRFLIITNDLGDYPDKLNNSIYSFFDNLIKDDKFQIKYHPSYLKMIKKLKNYTKNLEYLNTHIKVVK